MTIFITLTSNSALNLELDRDRNSVKWKEELTAHGTLRERELYKEGKKEFDCMCRSQDWKCPECGDVSQKLKPVTEASEKATQEAKELASQINFQVS